MAAHPVDSSCRFPDLIAAAARPEDNSEPESKRRAPDIGVGAFRGLAFALAFEAALAIAIFSGWEFWRLAR